MLKSSLLGLTLITLVVINGQAQVSTRSGKDYALFFIINDYDNWTDLPGSEKDISAIANELVLNYGFQQPDIKTNKTKAEILSILADYQNRSYNPDDQLLIYFSSHGYYDEFLGAIIPKDGKLNDPTYESWIDHGRLEAIISKGKCQHILLALDACYSGTFGSKYKNKPMVPSWEDFSDCSAKCKKALQYKSRLYLTSGGKERTPLQSQFAKKWIEALRLRNADGILGYYELYSVLSEASPTPMFGEFREHNVGGDFIFVSKKGCQINTNILTKTTQVAKDENTMAVKSKESDNNFVKITGGAFDMGCQFLKDSVGLFFCDTCSSDAYPIHKVTLSAYYISKYELTFDEFDLYCKDKDIKLPVSEKGRGKIPVYNVSWYDAIEYCNWRSLKENLQPCYSIDKKKKDPNNLGGSKKKWVVTCNWQANGYRLPTEAEWEYAARQCGERINYGNGTNIRDPKKINTDFGSLLPVGYINSPNKLGLHEMSGNVAEWCWDWYANRYPFGNVTNPHGVESGYVRIIRGGSQYYGNYNSMSVYNRQFDQPDNARNFSGFVGFRLVKSSFHKN